MWSQFFLENAHFAINVFAALVMFSVCWLYVDAWMARRSAQGLVRIVGYLLLCLSFIIHAGFVESSIVVSPIITGQLSELFMSLTRIPGYLLLIASLLMEPIERHPIETSPRRVNAVVLPLFAVSFLTFSHVVYPVLAVVVAFLYLRRATIGLEGHLKPVAWSFYVLSVSEFLGLSALFGNSTNVRIYDFVAPFGPIWVIEHVCIVASIAILARWVFGYLFKQFNTQLFIIITTITIVIFLLTTVSFTGLLVQSIQDESLRHLDTNVHVLAYTLESRKTTAISDVQVVAQNTQIIKAVSDKSRSVLADYANEYLLTKNASSVIITDDAGVVLARGEERDRVGDSISSDALVKRALLGETTSSIISREGVVAPTLYIESAVPIKDGSTIIGAVTANFAVDSAFVDGIKEATGLESTIYGDNIVSATTLKTSVGQERLVGIRMEQTNVKTSVLTNGENFHGGVTLANTPYFGAFMPLKDMDSNVVGMLFVGLPQVSVLQTAGRSIELTFLVTALLLVLSVFPAYSISKYLADQI